MWQSYFSLKAKAEEVNPNSSFNKTAIAFMGDTLTQEKEKDLFLKWHIHGDVTLFCVMCASHLRNDTFEEHNMLHHPLRIVYHAQSEIAQNIWQLGRKHNIAYIKASKEMHPPTIAVTRQDPTNDANEVVDLELTFSSNTFNSLQWFVDKSEMCKWQVFTHPSIGSITFAGCTPSEAKPRIEAGPKPPRDFDMWTTDNFSDSSHSDDSVVALPGPGRVMREYKFSFGLQTVLIIGVYYDCVEGLEVELNEMKKLHSDAILGVTMLKTHQTLKRTNNSM